MSKFKSMLPKNIKEKYNVNCMIADKHIHLYQKIVDGYTISKYIPGERLKVDGFTQTDKFTRTNGFFDSILKVLNKNDLFRGEDNLDYLYGIAARKKEHYLEYEYEYDEEDIKFELDEEGYLIPLFTNVHKTGWHENIADKNNTGRVRVCKPMYYGYKIILKNDKPKLEKSPLMVDIRDVLRQYPYFSEDFYEITTEILSPYDKVEPRKKGI